MLCLSVCAQVLAADSSPVAASMGGSTLLQQRAASAAAAGAPALQGCDAERLQLLAWQPFVALAQVAVTDVLAKVSCAPNPSRAWPLLGSQACTCLCTLCLCQCISLAVCCGPACMRQLRAWLSAYSCRSMLRLAPSRAHQRPAGQYKAHR